MTIGRNDKCPCGSGKKYKQCCMVNANQSASEARVLTGREAVASELQSAIKYYQGGQFSEAQAICQKLLQIAPKHPEVLYLLGVISYDAKAYDEAFHYVHQAKMLNPSNPFYQNLLGSTLCEKSKRDEAVIAFRKAISLKPDFAEAHNNLANTYLKQEKLNDAIASYQKALLIKPNYAEAHYNLANAYLKQEKLNDAIASYRKAISFRPNYAEAYQQLGSALNKQGDLDAAFDIYCKAFALNPKLDYLAGDIFLLSMQLCNWEHFQVLRAKLVDLVQADCLENPFTVVTLTDSLSLHRKAAEIYIKHENKTNIQQKSFPVREKKEKIHIGYFSSDFGNHPVTHLMIGLLESHDKNKYEISAFSFGRKKTDEWSERVASAVDHYIDVKSKSDKEIALLARSMGIDIAVDLNGFTGNSRPIIFAEKAAPIQVSHLGYLGTLGSEYIDYLIASTTLVPDNKKEFYTEKIAYVPNYMCIENKEEISSKTFKRADFGLPDQGVVFCSFNNNYKITPDVFCSWMKIIKKAEGSVLWLFVRNKTAISNLKIEAEKQGVDTARIVFAEVLPRDEHLARHNLADIFLDTYPCNAGATAFDALRMGVPIVTRVGETFASRIAASLLVAVDLPELVTATKEEYEALAVELATDPERLAALKQKLAKNLTTSSLFDAKLTTKYIEAAYTEMYGRYHAGLLPDHIHSN